MVKLKVLVTGSAGLVGQQVVKDLSNTHQVFSCYNESKPEYGDSVKMDLKNSEMISSILIEKKPDIVIHLGAMTGVDLCEKEKISASEINTKATEIIAKECSKLNSNWCIARTSTPFGLHPTKKSFPMWIIENLQTQKQIDVLIDQFTSPTYIPNLSRMLIEISERHITGIIHAAGASKISRYQMASMVSDKLNLDCTLLKQISINKMKWVAQRPKDSSLDVSRASSILNEKPQKIDQTLNLFIDEMKPTN